ncbi:Lipase 3 [Frankliniella occidentalis]|nr:Lipase 3 [Frankliniella occidentalis]
MAPIIVSRTPALLLLAVLAGPSTLTSAHLRAPRNSKLPVEAWLSTPELIEHWGYPAETHTVQTDDGFLIDVHRIPGPKLGDKPGVGSRRTPVLIAHGYSASSECMVLRPHDNLAFMLADAGFDVWLGNTRGNFYGKRHLTLSPQDKEFWDFGWHENGLLDMSATIDLILRETGEPSVVFVGHSMGCSSLFALLSDRPEYNAKVRAGFLLAPAVYFTNLQGVFLQIRRTPLLRVVHRSWLRLNMENPITRAPYPRLCLPPNSLVMNPSCMKLFTEAQGPFYNMANNTYMPILMRHWPAGSSVGQTTHFLQLIIQGKKCGTVHTVVRLSAN